MLRNNAAKVVLRDTYDEISERIVQVLRSGGLSVKEAMEIERSLARLRLALDELSP